MKLEGKQQGADSVPHDLHANANQQKGREPDDDGHSRFPEYPRQPIGERVAEENAGGDQAVAINAARINKMWTP